MPLLSYRKQFRKALICLLLFCLISVIGYGIGRLYYQVTGGFSISNITSNFPYDKRWETRALSSREAEEVDGILAQRFTYLGKGCQSYVFLSEDGQHVLKFFKYQRFKIQPWLEWFAFIPVVEQYRQQNIEKKQVKLERFFRSWKLAFEELQPETGFVFVHLNKTSHLKGTLVIYDKMGFEHRLDPNQYEFLVQRKAQMLCPYIDELMAEGKSVEAKQLLDRVIALIITEYQRGFADNDHALMQNTGVLDGQPIHIDVGQFVKEERAKDPEVYMQDLFSKTYRFRKWLSRNYPELASYLETQLPMVIGDQYYGMKPYFKPHE